MKGTDSTRDFFDTFPWPNGNSSDNRPQMRSPLQPPPPPPPPISYHLHRRRPQKKKHNRKYAIDGDKSIILSLITGTRTRQSVDTLRKKNVFLWMCSRGPP